MLDFPLWKKISLWAVTLALALAAMPSLLGSAGIIAFGEESDLPQVNLGLDLAGGSHLLLEADPGEVDRQRLENLEESVETALEDASPGIEFGDLSRQMNADGGELSFMLESPGDIDRARGALEEILMGNGLRQAWDLSVVDTQRVVLTPTPSAQGEALNTAMEAAVEVIRDRIDQLGTREPTIIRQGDNRIVVQVPGLEDPEALKALLGETA
ncbi:MAG: protein translocase subunit SecD, partial [Erythrobacter sp.]